MVTRLLERLSAWRFGPCRDAKMLCWTVAAFALTLSSASRLLAGGGPENVAVVVNADSFASQAVANAFVALRQVPAGNLIYLALGDLPSFEIVDVPTFRERILRPAFETLESRGLAGQIDYLVYSSDIPYAIRVGADVGDRELPRVLTETASINGLTYLFPLVLAQQPEYLALGVNFYARLPIQVVSFDQQQWTDDQRELYQQAIQQMREQQHEPALAAFSRLVESHPRAAPVWYHRACALARLDRLDQAIEALKRAVEHGWLDPRPMETDENLAPLRERGDFKAIVGRLAERSPVLRPTIGFRSAMGWKPDGQPGPPDAGMRYLLSTMLSVTSGRGLSVGEAIDHLERSAAADSTFPDGTIYLMENSDVRSRSRQPMFADTVTLLERLPVRAEIVSGTVPKNRDDVMGLVAGQAKFDWAASGSSILPGAICEHLTSTGGVMVEQGGQTPLSEFLRHGAAGTSGTVTEPYAIPAKFPLPFLHFHYAQGCSLAEAFYQSVAGPYQLLIVGDPLCAPWARRPTVQVPEMAESVSGELRIRPIAVPPPGRVIGRFELFVDGVRRALGAPGDTLTLDTNLLPDGPHEFRLVAVVADPIQTQGRAIWSVHVDNHGRRVRLESLDPTELPLGQSIRLRAAMDGAAALELHAQGRVLGQVEGAEGEFTIDSMDLGLGETPLVAMARTDPEGPIAAVGSPILIRIQQPPALAPIDVPKDAKLQPGISVSTTDGSPRIVQETHFAPWLEKAGVRRNLPAKIEGYIKISEEDLYQFQYRSPQSIILTINGRELASSDDDRWRFVPVSLQPGWHRMRVMVRGEGPQRLDLRFGGPGSYQVGARQFHAVTP
jgi:hypothetical protein